ncbi:MAG: type II toxin-antitoxin system VapC family toxin [Candidatus Nanopelagicales bacterium]|nr:type II toxin-antitoxin system VapC family toxin [Candidatus Nanopelagicales bacterium]
MIDANLLLYAYNPRAAQHEAGKEWLESALSGAGLVGFAWQTIWAFLRISTNVRVFERPLSAAEAVTAASGWLERPHARIMEPGERHLSILSGLLQEGQCAGPLVTDASLAAIAIEHGAVLCTTDRDFTRFGQLKWQDPIK